MAATCAQLPRLQGHRTPRRSSTSLLLFGLLFLLLFLHPAAAKGPRSKKPGQPRAVKLTDSPPSAASVHQPSPIPAPFEPDAASKEELLSAVRSALAGADLGQGDPRVPHPPPRKGPKGKQPPAPADMQRPPQRRPPRATAAPPHPPPPPPSLNASASAVGNASSSPSPSPSSWSSYLLPVLGAGGALLSLSLAYLYYRYRASSRARQESEVHTRPILQQLSAPRGRLQGCDWAVEALRWDEEGDCAHEFLGPFAFADRTTKGGESSKKEEASQAEESAQEVKGAQVKGVRRRRKD